MAARITDVQAELPSLRVPPADFNPVYREKWPSVFMIDTGRGRGSGWLIEPGLILTVEHVVRGFSRVMVRQATHPPFQATVVAVDASLDIALLRFDASAVILHPKGAPLSLGQVTVDDVARPLMALGYSGADAKADGTVGAAAANVGVLSQIVDFSGGFGKNLEMDAPVDPGDSGGPVFDQKGLVVGMVRAAQERTEGGQRVIGTFYAVHVDEIRAALPLLKGGQSR